MPRKRALLLTTPHSYRTQDYLDAATRLGIETVIALDTPLTLAAEWDFRLGVDFTNPHKAADRLAHILSESSSATPTAGPALDAVLALDDSGARVAALVAERLGLPHNSLAAAEAARNKYRMRTLLAACGAPVACFRPVFARIRT